MLVKQRQTGNRNASFKEKAKVGLITLYLVSIISGAALMALEIVGGRLLSPFFGSSVYVWGSIITVFLIALSAGYYLGGNLADKKPDIYYLLGFVFFSGTFILFIPSLVNPVVKLSHSAGLGNAGALAVAMILFFLPSLGLGMVSPYVVKLAVSSTSGIGNLVGAFYAISTFGSIIGTLGTTFVFIPLFGVRNIIFSIGIILILLSVTVLSVYRYWRVGITMFLIMLLAAYAAVAAAPNVAAGYGSGTDLLYNRETLYNNLAVVDTGSGLRYMMFNETQQTAMNKKAPNDHVWPYTAVMSAAGDYYAPEARSILQIGLGGGTIPKHTLAYRPGVHNDAVEIDPAVIKAAKDFFALPESPSLNLYAEDGRMFLQGKKNAYDVIMVDAYNRLSIPFHLTTKEFFNELAAALKPGGVVIFNVVSSIEGEYSPFFKSLLHTSDQVFPNRRLFQTEQTDPNALDNLILVVSKKELKPAKKLAGCPEYSKPINLSNAVVLTDNYAPVENLAVSIMTKNN